MNLAKRLKNINPKIKASPWNGYEHFRGYGVMSLPFSSGHLLGLRVFPENDFAPYHSVWHRSPAGDWSIYNDGPSLQTTCPRWWGPALRHAELKSIDLMWTGPNRLRVEMENPSFLWEMNLSAPLLLRILNNMSAAMPLWTWKSAPLLRIREWMARNMPGMGDLHFSFMTPSGQPAIILPEEIFFIKSSKAILDGHDLGHPTSLQENPVIGNVALPQGPAFMIGQAFAEITDVEAYRQTREEVRPNVSADNT